MVTSPLINLMLMPLNESREKLPDLKECNDNETIHSGSIVKLMQSFHYLESVLVVYGVVLKPVVRQLLVKKENILPTDATLLVDSDDDLNHF